MKVFQLKKQNKLTVTEKFIKIMLQNNIDAFQNTSKQFLRNNHAYSPDNMGLIA